MSAAVTIRRAEAADLPFILAMAPRLARVAQLAWRNEAEIMSFQRNFMAFCLSVPGSQSLLACAPDSTPLGFIHVEPALDSMSSETCGYVSLLAVTEDAEGKGLASALMAAAEDWAKAQGYRLLCLDVFASNERGRALYARQGFAAETLRLVKPLS